MNFIADIPYSPFDAAINDEINMLYRSVHEKMAAFDFQSYKIGDLTVYGIYPNYSQQQMKVLFLGREAIGLSGYNYVEALFKAYKNGHICNGKMHLNRSAFHRRMLKNNFYIQNPGTSFAELPKADEIGRHFGDVGGTSFAFMNLSKFSNESGSWKTIWPLLRESNLDGEFMREFISIIGPNLIISMGLHGELKRFFEIEKIQDLGSASLYEIAVNSERIHMIDGYHYSAFNVRDEMDIFDPIRKFMEGYCGK